MDKLTNGPNFGLKVFIAGGMSGLIAKTCSSPLARLTILLQTGGIKGAANDTIGLTRHILGKEGVMGLFRGNGADLLRQIPYSAMQYLVYENLKARMIESGIDNTESMVFTRLFCGGVAGAASIAATYPLDLVRARLCIQTGENDKYRGILHAMRTVMKEEGGIRALYRGCGTAVAERFPNMAINYAAYDLIRNSMASHGLVGLQWSVVNGALTGAICTTCTYPLDVVMRNLQTNMKYAGPVHAAKDVYQTYGIQGFYRGLGPQLAKAIPYSTAAWFSYDAFKRILDFEVR